MTQDHNPFTEKERPPEAVALQAALGGAWPLYTALLQQAEGFEREWGWTKSGGWACKLAGRGKALGYILPRPGGFLVSMALREPERDALLADPALRFAAARLQNARAYREGCHVQLDSRSDDAADLLAFMQTLIGLR